jgi:hypothetical protein
MNGFISLLLALFAALLNLSGAGNSLSVSPASQSVNPGDSFAVTVQQHADTTTLGAQSDVSFDPALLQITDVQAGSAYTGGSLQMGVAPQTHADAIAEANTTGTLRNVGAFFFPGHAPVPAGVNDFIVIQFQARDGVNGTSPITLGNADMVDGEGNELDFQLANGEVVVGTPQEPTPTGTPTPTATDTPTPTPSETPEPGVTPSETPIQTPTSTPLPATPTPTAVPATPTSSPTAMPTATPTSSHPATPTPAGAASLSLAPSSITVPPGSQFQVTVKQQASVVTSGVQLNFTFDPSLLQIVSVDKSTAYAHASLIYGEVLPNGEDHTGPAAISDANTTGTLKNVAAFFIPGSGSVQPGPQDFLLITLQARSATGTSQIGLTDTSMVDDAGNDLAVTGSGGEVVVQSGAAAPPTPVPANDGSFTSFTLPDTLPASGAGSAPANGVDWGLAVLAGCVALSSAGVLAYGWRRARR